MYVFFQPRISVEQEERDYYKQMEEDYYKHLEED